MTPVPTTAQQGRNRASIVAAGVAVTVVLSGAVGAIGRASTPPIPTPPSVTGVLTVASDPPAGPPVPTVPQPTGVLPLPDESPAVAITTVRCRESEDIGGFVTVTVTNPSDGGPARRYHMGTAGSSGEVTLPDGQFTRFSVGRIAVGTHTVTVSDVGTGVTVETSFTIEPCADPTTTTTFTATTATTRPGDPGAPGPAETDIGAPAASSGGVGGDPALPEGGTAAAGHAQVVAQGVVVFPVGSFRWDHRSIGAGDWPLAYEVSPPMLVAADGPDPILVVADGAGQALLHGGEAAFVAAGSTGAVAPTFDGAVTTGHRITFVADDGDDSFGPGEGGRDTNLVRDVLASGETFRASSTFPVLVIVTAGTVTDMATGATLPAGTTATLGTGIELRNGGEQPAVVLAATLGDPVTLTSFGTVDADGEPAGAAGARR